MRVHELIARRFVSIVTGLLAAILLSTQGALASGFDSYYSFTTQNKSGSSQSQLNLVLSGNVGSSIVNTNNGLGGAVTTSYDGVNNLTTLSFLGSSVGAGSSAQVGLTLSSPGQMVGEYWGAVSSSPSTDNLVPIAALSFNNVASGGSGNPIYLIINTSLNDPQGDWLELPAADFNGDGLLDLVVADSDSEWLEPFDVNSAGYMLSDTQIPLDDLNFDDLSATDFNPIPGFTPGLIIQGSSVTSGPIDAPEPSIMVLLGLGSASLLLMRRKTRKA